jgi:uncharacterized protein YdeI (YjbR/CyaY-like superfamily)
MHFRATIDLDGTTATGMRVPAEIVEALASGKRPPVRVTINGYTYRSTVAVMDGEYLIGVSAENRAGAGVDAEPREVTVPSDFAAALDAQPAARQTFDRLSYSNKSWHVLSIEGAKTDETRQRRIAKSVEALREGRIR